VTGSFINSNERNTQVLWDMMMSAWVSSTWHFKES